MGESWALLALAIATMILTAVGVFIDVAVIIVAPIALSIARRAGLSKLAILLAMIGGGKAGNVMSPNPNAIAVSDTFHVPLTSVMMTGIISIWPDRGLFPGKMSQPERPDGDARRNDFTRQPRQAAGISPLSARRSSPLCCWRYDLLRVSSSIR